MPLSVLARTVRPPRHGGGPLIRPPPSRLAHSQSVLGEPELVAGNGRADTVVMRALPGQVFMKTGAEGVYCGAFPELGLGFALKIDDGAKRAAAGAAMALVEQLLSRSAWADAVWADQDLARCRGGCRPLRRALHRSARRAQGLS